MLGTVLSALKGVVTNQVQVGELKLHPMDLLMRMAPLACVQTFIASWWTGELEKMGHWEWDWFKVWVLVGNGVLAFSMNLVSFTANKKTSALTMGVAGECIRRQWFDGGTDCSGIGHQAMSSKSFRSSLLFSSSRFVSTSSTGSESSLLYLVVHTTRLSICSCDKRVCRRTFRSGTISQ